ncbi:RIP metalloprotease RseP [Vibrio splendidus]|nr:RIP metalloprotease RseP [Vibrio splendidus]MCC4882991.1 RIP metalloprotease RseP [Vibrio splendidus]
METVELIFKSIVFFSLLMFIVVGFHEKGHYLAARMLGIKVLKFSIGMGKEVWGRTGRTGIRYSLSALPLGGYVQMLDTSEMEPEELAEYTKEDISNSFDNAPVWKRFIVVAMGPFFNLVMAFVAFAIISYGTLYIPSSKVDYASDTIVYTDASSLKIEKGDVISSINGNHVESWSDVTNEMIASLGNSDVEIEIVGKGKTTIDMTDKKINSHTSSVNYLFGMIPHHQNYQATISVVGEGSPAEKAGLLAGDKILSLDNKPVANFYELSSAIEPLHGKEVNLTYERDSVTLNAIITIGSTGNPIDGLIGYLGVSPTAHDLDKSTFLVKEVGVIESMSISVDRTLKSSMLIINTLEKLIVGNVSPTSLSGAIGIADASQKAASYGLMSFIGFVGVFSVNLMVLNLLPIKPLDGGHLFGYAIETVIQRKVPEIVDKVITNVGILLIAILMILGIGSDMIRIIY